MTWNVIPYVVTCVLAVTAAAPAQLVIDDGKEHTLAETVRAPNEEPAVWVSNQSLLNVVEGANIFGVRLEDAELMVTGGRVRSPEPPDAYAPASAIIASGDSHIRVQGANTHIMASIELHDMAELNVDGGLVSSTITGITFRDSSRGSMSGGLVAACQDDEFGDLGIQILGNASFVLSGGDVQCLDEFPVAVHVEGRFTMTGGRIELPNTDMGGTAITVNSQGRADVYGGDVVHGPVLPGVAPRIIAARGMSTLQLFGSDFNYPLGPVPDLEGTIAGKLADGSEFEWGFAKDATASIILVPEPASASYVILGVMMLLRRQYRGRRFECSPRPDRRSEVDSHRQQHAV